MHAALADDGLVGELLHGLAHQRHIRAVSHAAVDGGARVRKRGGGDIAADGERMADVLDGGAVRHHEHALLLQRTHRVLKRLAVGARAIGSVDCHDVGACHHAGARMTQRGRDVDALVAFLPDADDGHLSSAFDGRDIGQALAADAASAAQLARTGHLRHGLGVAQRLAHIRLAAGDDLAAQLLDNGIHFPILSRS